MLLSLMRSLTHEIPLNRWSNDYIAPGAVGSVGDVLMTPKLKSSSSYLPIRWDKTWSGKNEIALGANVSDGQATGYVSGGGPASVQDAFWRGDRSFKSQIGFRVEDLRQPDVNIEPFLQSDGGCAWKNSVATVYNSMRSGDAFLPLPGPFRPADGEIQRFPTVRVTDIIGGDDYAPEDNGPLPIVGGRGQRSYMPLRNSIR